MADETPTGERYSLLYLRPEEAVADSLRLRKRLARHFEATVLRPDEHEFGRLLEQELGIDVLVSAPRGYRIPWDRIDRWALRDVLCTITLVGRYAHALGGNAGANYPKELARILSEESASYRLDKKCGVHPAVDSAHQANLASTVRGIGKDTHRTTRAFIVKADENLLPQGDQREAIRSAFDAVENVFKMSFDGAIALNSGTVQSYLRPFVERTHADTIARRTALKTCDSMKDWADACHNYRHAPGEPDPAPPPEELAVVLVSQGFTYVRWLADLERRYVEA